MSKAFASNEMEPPEVRPLPPPPQEGGRPITAEGFKALQQQIGKLVEVDRTALTREPQTLETEMRLKELDARIQLLSARLNQVVVVEPAAQERRVCFGVEVLVKDGNGRLLRYRVVGPDEADARRGHISVHSPLAQALLGREPGDVVDVELPRGEEEFTVMDVRPWAPPVS